MDDSLGHVRLNQDLERFKSRCDSCPGTTDLGTEMAEVVASSLGAAGVSNALKPRRSRSGRRTGSATGPR